MVVIPTTDLGGGVSLKTKDSSPPGTTGKNDEISQMSRALQIASYFASGCVAINASQFFGAPLYLVNKDWYNAWIASTKQSFGLLTMTMTQWWAPTVVKVSGDKSMRGQLLKTQDGLLQCNFPERLVLIANHQIYTDWLYLWWMAYTNGMHGRLYIVLKESLKRLPVLGWGMQFSQFIFMKRHWEKDKPNMQKHLEKLNSSGEPMWLVLFPEGTNLAPDTREKSRAWARKNGIKDMQHQLLPRSTGLHFCLQELQQSVEYVYDCTIAYEGVKRGEYAQDVYTLKSSYLEGRPPKGVHFYWRRFKISKIPLESPAIFERWLQARWREKDYLIEMWHRTGQFPADSGAEQLPNGTIRRGCGHLETTVRPSQWYEFLQIFAPIGVLALVLSVFYGALPKPFMKPINKEAPAAEPADIPSVEVNSGAPPISIGSFFTPEGQSDIFKNITASLHSLAGVPRPKQIEATPGKLNKAKVVPKNFLTELEAEETSRKRRKKISASTMKSAITAKSNFCEDLKGEEAARRGSVITASSLAPSTVSTRKTTFWDDLKAEESARRGSVITLSSTAPSTTTNKKGMFWNDLKNEENARRGSVTSAPNKAPPSLAESAASRPKAPVQAVSTSAVAPKPAPSVSSTTSKVKARTQIPPKAAPIAAKPTPKNAAAKKVATANTSSIKPTSTAAAKKAPVVTTSAAKPSPAPAAVKSSPKKVLNPQTAVKQTPPAIKTTPSAAKKLQTPSNPKTVPSAASPGFKKQVTKPAAPSKISPTMASSGTKNLATKPAPPNSSPTVPSAGIKKPATKPAPPKPTVPSSGPKKLAAKAAPPKILTQSLVNSTVKTPADAKTSMKTAAPAQKPPVRKVAKP